MAMTMVWQAHAFNNCRQVCLYCMITIIQADWDASGVETAFTTIVTCWMLKKFHY